MSEVCDRHSKQKIAMRGWLEGRRYFKAINAFQLMLDMEKGCRKDGITPKAHHQLSVARLVSTLEPHLLYPEDTIAAAFLHDTLEDHSDKIGRSALKSKFGDQISDAVWTLSKKSSGIVKDTSFYFSELAMCPIASIVKLADRNHNIQTMNGVFTPEKQIKYMKEVRDNFFPMMKIARRSFPSQYSAYENLKILLRCQINLIEASLVSKENS